MSYPNPNRPFRRNYLRHADFATTTAEYSPVFKRKLRSIDWTPLIETPILDVGVLERKGVKSHAEGERVYRNDRRQTWRPGEVLPRSGGARSEHPCVSIVCRVGRESGPVRGGRYGQCQSSARQPAHGLRGDGRRSSQATAPSGWVGPRSGAVGRKADQY